MHDTFRMLFVTLMTGTSMLDKRGRLVSVAAGRTVTDGMKDHKLEAARGVSSDQSTRYPELSIVSSVPVSLSPQ
jgi:hypothetical protein